MFLTLFLHAKIVLNPLANYSDQLAYHPTARLSNCPESFVVGRCQHVFVSAVIEYQSQGYSTSRLTVLSVLKQTARKPGDGKQRGVMLTTIT